MAQSQNLTVSYNSEPKLECSTQTLVTGTTQVEMNSDTAHIQMNPTVVRSNNRNEQAHALRNNTGTTDEELDNLVNEWEAREVELSEYMASLEVSIGSSLYASPCAMIDQ